MTRYTYNAQQINQMQQQAQLQAAELQHQALMLQSTTNSNNSYGTSVPGQMQLYDPPDPYTRRVGKSTYVDYIYMTENVFRRMESLGMRLSVSKERNVCAAISYIARKGVSR